MYSVGSAAQKNGFSGPVIGAKLSTKNERNFDSKILKAGQGVIHLQMGTNQCESQKGMTPYGLGRQVIYVNGKYYTHAFFLLFCLAFFNLF